MVEGKALESKTDQEFAGRLAGTVADRCFLLVRGEDQADTSIEGDGLASFDSGSFLGEVGDGDRQLGSGLGPV